MEIMKKWWPSSTSTKWHTKSRYACVTFACDFFFFFFFMTCCEYSVTTYHKWRSPKNKKKRWGASVYCFHIGPDCGSLPCVSAQDDMGAEAAGGGDCGATEGAEWHAGLPVPGARTRPQVVRGKRSAQGEGVNIEVEAICIVWYVRVSYIAFRWRSLDVLVFLLVSVVIHTVPSSIQACGHC